MSTPAIEIKLLRISADSNYLEFSITCPEEYRFNTLYITKYDVITHSWEAGTYDGSTLIATINDVNVVMRIATASLSNSGTNNDQYVTMYKVVFGAAIPDPGSEVEPTTLSMTALVSNINFVYANLLDLVMSFTNCCISPEQYDVLDRNHMILYAHTEAMRLGREQEAIFFYNIIWNLFVSCGPTVRQSNLINPPCNCDG